jgi:hypothetical protein
MYDTYTRREIISLKQAKVKTYTPKISLQNVMGFRILKVVAHNVFYNIILGVNDTFQWLDNGGGSRFATIPPGKYDFTSLATAFDIACNAVGAETFTTTYDVNTKLYTINTSLAITPQWFSGSASSINISYPMGFFNDTITNENSSTSHKSNFPATLIPSHYLLKSKQLSSGRKSSGGGGGTQYYSDSIPAPVDSAPQSYLNVLPNQVDGSLATFVYRAPDNDTEVFWYNSPRQIDNIDLQIIHPDYPDLEQASSFFSLKNVVTYEIEFICMNRYK